MKTSNAEAEKLTLKTRTIFPVTEVREVNRCPQEMFPVSSSARCGVQERDLRPPKWPFFKEKT